SDAESGYSVGTLSPGTSFPHVGLWRTYPQNFVNVHFVPTGHKKNNPAVGICPVGAIANRQAIHAFLNHKVP
ncbi:MAG: hypothetical protein AABZ13_04265, partial [Planctomycetota bacterium]